MSLRAIPKGYAEPAFCDACRTTPGGVESLEGGVESLEGGGGGGGNWGGVESLEGGGGGGIGGELSHWRGGGN